MDRELDIGTRRRRTVRRGAWFFAALAGVLGIWFWLPGQLRPSIQQSRIRTAVVDRGTVEATIQAAGTVLPAFEKVVASPTEARVLRILRQPGESVQPGDEILELDTSATELELARIHEQIAQKASEKRQAALGMEKEVSEVQSRLEGRKLDAELLGYRLQQQRGLHAEGLTSELDLKKAEVELQKSRVEIGQLEDAVGNATRTGQARIEQLALDLKILERENDEVRHRLDLADTKSDRQGVLTWVVPKEGMSVQRGEEIARIADMASFRIEASVSDAYSTRIALGQPAKVEVAGERLEGRVTGIHPTIENGTARFSVDLENASHASLRHNLRVDVFVVTDVRDDTLRLRKGPFAQTGSYQQIFVIRDGEAWLTDAEIGLSGLEHYEIVDGLELGDEVIISSMKDYLHLDRVRVKGRRQEGP